jgi:putative aldouronate transport system substrate-binding protein
MGTQRRVTRPAARLSRRAALGGGLGIGGAVAAGRWGRVGAQTPAAGGLVAGVDYIPAPVPGAYDAFLRSPAPFRSYDGTPGRGGTVRVLTILWGAPVTGREDNQYWQELDERLGVTWEPIFVPFDQYGEGTAATIASGDIPDLFYVNPDANADHLYQAIVQGAFADLTDYLTGDALAAYPNLAALDPAAYRNIAVDGRLYGVPKPIPRFDAIPFVRGDWQDTLGLATPKNADGFFALMNGFAQGDPDGNGSQDTWGLGGTFGGWNVGNLTPMFGVPNQWRLEPDGRLVRDIETEEFRQTLEFCRRMADAGIYHPDTPTMTFEQEESGLLAGTIGLQAQGFATFFGNAGLRGRIKRFNPEAELRGLVLPAAAGGAPVTHNGPGSYGYTAISAAAAGEDGRVEELLRILDYLLAPFFSEEQIFLEYGVEGVHHTVDDNGARVLTELGEQEIGLLTYFPLIWSSRPEPQAWFFPDAPDEAAYAQELATKILAAGIDNPALGLFSPTNVDKAAELDQLQSERIAGIVSGRDDLPALDGLIEEWRSRGGDQIRAEYEQALANR